MDQKQLEASLIDQEQWEEYEQILQVELDSKREKEKELLERIDEACKQINEEVMEILKNSEKYQENQSWFNPHQPEMPCLHETFPKDKQPLHLFCPCPKCTVYC